jgi:predicted nuclease of predicted toxin-antitoxin system
VAGFLADERIAGDLVDRLRGLGLDVAYAREQCRGCPDAEVLRLATEGGRILVTHDLGFGELAIRRRQPATGVIVLSLHTLPTGARERYGAERIHELGDCAIGHLMVIEPGRVRMRPLPGQKSRPSE